MKIASVFWLRLSKTDAGVITDEMSDGTNHLEFPMGGAKKGHPRHAKFTGFFGKTSAEFSDPGSGKPIEIEVETLGLADPRKLVLKRRGEEGGKKEPAREGYWILSSQRPSPKQHPALEPGGYFLPETRDEIIGQYFLILKDAGNRLHAWAGSSAKLKKLSSDLSSEIPSGDSRAWGVIDFTETECLLDEDQVSPRLNSTFSKETVEKMATELLSGKDPVDKPAGNTKPPNRDTTASQFKRDAKVVAWIRQEADGKCELCGSKGPFEKNGKPFLEVHHVIYLSDGGHDTVENAVAVCPNCHRRCHLSDDANAATEKLYDDVDRLDRDACTSQEEGEQAG